MTGARALGPLLLLLLLAAVTIASPSASVEPVPALRVTGAGEQSLAGMISSFHDVGGVLTFADIAAPGNADGFTPLPARSQSLGFRAGATWLRFSIVNDTGQGMERWLQLNFPLTQHCTLYSVTADGRLDRSDNGADVALDRRPIRAQAILLPVRLQPLEQRWFYLRIETRTAVIADLTLWDPGTYANTSRNVTALKYLGIGASCVVVMLSIVSAKARREWRLLGAGIAHLLIALVIATLDGLLFPLFEATQRPWQSQLAWTLAFSGFAAQFCFARAFLALPGRYPRMDLVTRGCTLVSAIAAPMPWLVFVPTLFAPLSVSVIACMTLVTLIVAYRGEATARWYAAVWGAFWLAALMYMLQLTGWPHGLPFLRDNPVVFGFCLSGFVLCAALYVFIERVRNEADAARGELLRHMASEKQRLDAAIAEQTRALREAKLLAEEASSKKSAFLSASSHELRTPLHTIIGYTDLVLREVTGETRARLQTVANSSRQLLRVIDDVLQFSRAQALAPEFRDDEVDLRGLIAHLERSASLLSRRGRNRFLVQISRSIPDVVMADEQRLLQVLGNLVGNAAKYTDNGTIRLDVTVDADDAEWSDASSTLPVRFSVSDDGPGIPEAEQTDIFQPFRRGSTGRHRPGAGLGLAIAQDLVAAMGGRITLHSIPGKGSTFSFVLPMRRVVEAAQNAVAGTAGGEAAHGTVLLVDTDAEDLRQVDELCRSIGFATRTAADVERVRRICADHPGGIDAILIGAHAHAMDGWAFLREARGHRELDSIPIVLMSSGTLQPPEELPLDVHFDASLCRPIDGDALARTLQRLRGLRADAGAEVMASDGPPLVRPPEPMLADCRLLLDEGSITGLLRRLEQIAASDTRYQAFCDAVGTACRAADLPGVAALIRPDGSRSGDERAAG